MASGYVEDIRALKRTKSEAKADWLIWRKGKFSSHELESIQSGLDSWVSETCKEKDCGKDEVLESLKWARENKLTAWCDIATRCSLPHRKIGSIRHCILRRMLPGCETNRWTDEQTAEFIALQEAHGKRAWKKIAQDTGRTMEACVNKGRVIEQSLTKKRKATTRFSKEETLRVKLSKLIREGDKGDSFEFAAIRPDCKLVALVRKYQWSTGSGMESIHSIPSSKIADKLRSTPNDVRLRWHHDILPQTITRVHAKLDDEGLMNDYLILRLRLACKGKLTDTTGNQVYPAYDWNSIDWKSLVPLWPQTYAETRLKSMLREQPKFALLPLPKVVKGVLSVILKNRDEESILAGASRHFEELENMLNAIADRGDMYLREDKASKIK